MQLGFVSTTFHHQPFHFLFISIDEVLHGGRVDGVPNNKWQTIFCYILIMPFSLTFPLDLIKILSKPLDFWPKK
jgi:hypothetical protein